MNRYAELTPAAKTIIDELINAIAAHPGWQESLAFDALKATRKAARKIAWNAHRVEHLALRLEVTP